MDNLELYAPYIVIVLTAIGSFKLYARTDELEKVKVELMETKAKLMEYAMEHFITKDVYLENHNSLQNQMAQIRQDVSEVKNLLIGIINKAN